MTVRYAFFLFILLLLPGPLRGQSSIFDRYDVLHYDLSLNVEPRTKSFAGVVGMTVRLAAPSDALPLHASQKTLTIDSVTVDKKRAKFSRKGDTLSVALSALRPEDTTAVIRLFYRGRSEFQGNYDGGGVYFPDSAGGKRFSTISEPSFARLWWPCKDIPSDKATASVSVTVPRGLTAVSNGLLKSVRAHKKTTTFRWETGYPIATYLVSIAAAPYVSFHEPYVLAGGDTMTIFYYVYPQDSSKAREDFKNTRAILDFLSQRFGEYPFAREKFGYAEVDGDMTMEHQTVCSISASIIDGKRTNEQTYLHETAHHWFGDLITPKTWYDAWLNEGFATYMEALYSEFTSGKEKLREFAERVNDTPPGSFPMPVVGRTDTAFWDAFNFSVYYKGAMVLHMLRGIVGDSAFFRTLRTYCDDPALRYANATTRDFTRLAEAEYGKPLRWFFDEWLHGYGDSVDRPLYVYAWHTAPDGARYSTTLQIEQRQSARLLFTMPIHVAIYAAGRAESVVVNDSLQTQTFTITTTARPDSLVLDPDHWLFRKADRKEWDR